MKTFNTAPCPFIQKLYGDCYYTKMNSIYAEAVLYYCGRNFEECKIYKNLSGFTPDKGEKLYGLNGKGG